jgi:hypothetical protein
VAELEAKVAELGPVVEDTEVTEEEAEAAQGEKTLRYSHQLHISRGYHVVKHFIIFILLGVLSACSGLESKSSQLDIGSSKDDVLKIMGTPAYPVTQDGVIAWRYAARIRFGYCDYREFYFFRDKVIHMNQYYHSSMAGCTAGLQKIDWGPVLAKVDELNREHPPESKQTTQP